MTDSERDIAVKDVRNDILGVRKLLRELLVVVFVALTVMSVTGIVTVRLSSDTQKIGEQTKKIGEQNRAFLQNFSDYMRCLIVTDQEAVKAYGLENYFNLCDDLLFRNTGLVPTHTKVTVPPSTTTTTTIKAGG